LVRLELAEKVTVLLDCVPYRHVVDEQIEHVAHDGLGLLLIGR